MSLHAISRLQMASSFSINEEISIADMARNCSLDEDETRRILRHSITNYIFKEPRDGIIAHTAVSKALAQVPLLREFLEQACD